MYPSDQSRRYLDPEAPPPDWVSASSLEEALRRQPTQPNDDRSQVRIRHRAEPPPPLSKAGALNARPVSAAQPEDSPFVLPQQPIWRTEQAAEPERTPMAQPEPRRTRRRAQRTDEPVEKPAPKIEDMPEWLRVAQQNATPESVRRQPPPRIPQPQEQPQAPQQPWYIQRQQPAPKPLQPADVYAAAGYPEELLEEQRRLDAREQAQRLRKHKGAMSVLPEDEPQRQASSNQSYPQPRSALPQRRALTPEEKAARLRAIEQYDAGQVAQYLDHREPLAAHTDPDEEEAPAFRIPWLGIATTLVLLTAIFLWIGRTTATKELDQVYLARQEAQQQVVDAHPYQYRELIEAQAEQYNLHPAFVASIVLNESSFRPQVKSSADAMGLMQIRPDTGDYINRALDVPNYHTDLLYDPETNIRFGCYYLGELSDRFGGDPILVAAAYNAGPTNVQNWLNNSLYSTDRRTIPLDKIPFGDTQTYARRVLRDYAAYKRLYYELPEADL